MDSIVNAVNVDQIKGEAASMHVSPDILMRNLEETVKSRLFITFCSIRVLASGRCCSGKFYFDMFLFCFYFDGNPVLSPMYSYNRE